MLSAGPSGAGFFDRGFVLTVPEFGSVNWWEGRVLRVTYDNPEQVPSTAHIFKMRARSCTIRHEHWAVPSEPYGDGPDKGRISAHITPIALPLQGGEAGVKAGATVGELLRALTAFAPSGTGPYPCLVPAYAEGILEGIPGQVRIECDAIKMSLIAAKSPKYVPFEWDFIPGARVDGVMRMYPAVRCVPARDDRLENGSEGLMRLREDISTVRVYVATDLALIVGVATLWAACLRGEDPKIIRAVLIDYIRNAPEDASSDLVQYPVLADSLEIADIQPLLRHESPEVRGRGKVLLHQCAQRPEKCPRTGIKP